MKTKIVHIIFSLSFLFLPALLLASNIGDHYENNDGNHSPVNLSAFPEVTKLPTQKRFVLEVRPDKVIVGNASLATSVGGESVSLPRYYIQGFSSYANNVYDQFTSCNTFVYPSRFDHSSSLDKYFFLMPFTWTSQGSSFSDRKFVTFIFKALDNFSVATKDKLKKTGLLMPTIQMLYRRTSVNSDSEYLTGKAHPSVFQSVTSAQTTEMENMASNMAADEIPPMAQISVVDNGNWDAEAGVDYFHSTFRREKGVETPVSISRIFRGREYTKHITLTAADSYDANNHTLTYHWVVLRGDSSKVRIIPQNAQSSIVRIEVDYHPETKIGTSNRKTNRVDVGLFVHNGFYYSNPASFSSYTLRNEERTYVSNRVDKITYNSKSILWLDREKDWDSDTFVYDGPDLVGWRRLKGSTLTEYTKEGFRVLQGSLDTAVTRAQRVKYLENSTENKIKEVTVGDPFNYDENDSQAPTVTITEPSDGDTLSGNKLVRVTASDNVLVKKVEYFSGSRKIGESTSEPTYTVIWHTVQDPDGPRTLTAKAHDLVGNIGTASINVTLSNGNNNTAPIANSQSVSTDEDIAKPITLTASDADSDPLTYTITQQPAKGSLSGAAPNLTYTPNANANGSDTFKFKVNDGKVDSNVATVSININAVNDAPVASDQNISTDEDIVLAVVLAASDVDGDSLTYTFNQQPTKGTITGTAPNITYTPNSNVSGDDSLTYTVNDGTVDSNSATVSITINPVNDAPVADAGSATTNEDIPKSFILSGSDVEGDALTYTVTKQPTHGTISGTAPNLTYTPNANFNGDDSLEFKVNDGTVDSSVATFNLTVNAVNDTPVANNQNALTTKNTAKAVTLTGSDVDGDALTYAVVTSPTNGSLSGTVPNLTYEPDTNFSGLDSFTFKVNDGTVDSPNATISINVTNTNTAPVANDQNISTDEDTAKNVTLTASDVDGNPLTYTITQQPTKGILSGTAPNLIYTPNDNKNGNDSFQFKANDGLVDSNNATVSIIINAINDVPVANSQNVVTAKNTNIAITLTGSDVDENTTLTYAVVNLPSHGTLSGNVPNLTYEPGTNFFGDDSFTFKVNDGTVDSLNATVSIKVTGTLETGSISLTQANATVDETAGTVTLTIERTGGSDGAASVDYTTQEGLALEGLDYNKRQGNLSYANGEMGIKSVVIPIVNDAIEEGNESFSLNLSNVNGASLGSITSTLIQIKEDDFTIVTVDNKSLITTVNNATVLRAQLSNRARQGLTLQTRWIQVSGPGTMLLDGPNSLETQVRFDQPGSYDVQVEVLVYHQNQLLRIVSDTMAVTVQGPPSTNVEPGHKTYFDPRREKISIPYQVSGPTSVTLQFFNQVGNRIQRLFEGAKSQGSHVAVWDGRSDDGEIVSSGIYYVLIESDDGMRLKRKVAVIK